jgi:hypothetical protein
MSVQTADTSKEVTCRECGATYVPNFVRDFYPDGADPKIGRCESCVMSQAFSPKKIDADKLKSVCKLGEQQETCSYLIAGADGFECAKGSSLHREIQQRREAGTIRAMGDNCQGPPDYKPVEV